MSARLRDPSSPSGPPCSPSSGSPHGPWPAASGAPRWPRAAPTTRPPVRPWWVPRSVWPLAPPSDWPCRCCCVGSGSADAGGSLAREARRASRARPAQPVESEAHEERRRAIFAARSRGHRSDGVRPLGRRASLGAWVPVPSQPRAAVGPMPDHGRQAARPGRLRARTGRRRTALRRAASSSVWKSLVPCRVNWTRSSSSSARPMDSSLPSLARVHSPTSPSRGTAAPFFSRWRSAGRVIARQ